ncbi:hypothetical protein P153DRAFT_140550 [Dothidotthia symphoricarpi CBS 119687]|uniref:Uncharacterized protein n=1 Tax=Dothidotthia symphoricarpi CBS 119687 TaxID=1392245 RepID=A0A6A5ZYL6_9PLEO|nr:uncharacterized protein P153DRAFT_140550 [Dothidotthia symphoricarpi CBS 119687]KAF2123877.1 hypothetical protein P153DRAFT_140550 [Dothidotthia symphoricarpi CBS 119687]
MFMGSIPTLKPLLSQLHSRLLSMNSYPRSKIYYGTDDTKTTNTIGSKPFKGLKLRRVGSVTIALEEIDNMTSMTRHEAGSSTESILGRTADRHEDTLVVESEAPRTREGTSPQPLETDGIQVAKGYKVDYTEKIEKNVAEFRQSGFEREAVQR